MPNTENIVTLKYDAINESILAQDVSTHIEKHIILVCKEHIVTGDLLKQIVRISKEHNARKKSFVIVSDDLIDHETLTIVPTETEAKDIIIIEDIERDLDI